MKKFIMAVGLPFSGKSTAAEHYRKLGYDIISRDEILNDILNHEDFIAQKKLTLSKLPQPVPRNLEWNITSDLATRILAFNVALFASESPNNVFYDGTNLKKETRLPILEQLKGFDEVEALVFRASKEEILERARKATIENTREGFHAQATDEGDLLKMMEWYQEPVKEEGFTKITTFTPPTETVQELKIAMR